MTDDGTFSGDASELLAQGMLDYGITILDPDGRVLIWAPGAERLKGFSAQDAVGEHFSRFYTDSDRAAGVPQATLRVAAENGRASVEGWRLRKDGTRFWAMVVIDAVVRNERVVGFTEITRDVTELRGAQLAVAECERQLRTFFDSVTDYAIFMMDGEGYVTNWNLGAARVAGYTAQEIIGQHFSRFYMQEDVAAGAPWQALEVARRESRFEGESWRVRKDGSSFWANVIVEAITQDGKLTGFSQITRDLTERRDAQIALDQSRAQLFQSQKMEAVGQLTGGLAHDFNNLLTGISGSLEMVRTRLAQGRTDQIERYLRSAENVAERAAALTHRLLAFARRQTLDPKIVDLNHQVSELASLVRSTSGPQIEFETNLAAHLWPVLCDPQQMDNVLLNLCINARDAMPAGGTLTVETANVRLDDRAARERDLAPGPYACISVADTGIGMAPEVVARAFDPFFTTKPPGMGTGLGLSMAYGFARQSGGHIQIDSQSGRGTVVRIWLPRYGEDLVEEPAGKTPAAAVQPNPPERTIVIVDDEQAVRMLMTDALQDEGFAVMEASDGPSGLRLLESAGPVDLLVTDVGLPGGMNGRQLADAARQARPGLRTLFVTGYAQGEALGDDGPLEGLNVLTKPFALEALVGRIKTILAMNGKTVAAPAPH